MSLPRPDIRARLDADTHAALLALCKVDGLTVAQFVERTLVPVIRDRLRAAFALQSEAGHLKILSVDGNGK